MKIFSILFLCLFIVLIIGLIIGGYYVNYQYESNIGSYVENAYDMNTPEGMRQQLEFATNAMHKNNLKPEMYGAWIFKKPTNSMKFQYAHLDAIIERVKAVEKWKQLTYGKENVQTENMGDVYNTKMENLRHYIMEEQRSDWIAEKTWYVNNAFFWYIPVHVLWISMLILCIVFLIIGFHEDF